MSRMLGLNLVCCLALVSYASAGAQAKSSEARAIQAFDAAKKSPLELHAFLERMPKGADLHMHLSGAIYAETFLEDGPPGRALRGPSESAVCEARLGQAGHGSRLYQGDDTRRRRLQRPKALRRSG